MHIPFAILALFLYALLCLAVHYYSFRPLYKPLPPSYDESSLNGLVIMQSRKGTKLMGRWLPNPDAKMTLLFSHGNKSDLGRLTEALEEIRSQGFSVFAYDYPGYGRSEGRPTEKGLYESIQTAYEYLTQTLQIPSSNIILMGRSLGGGPSVELAKHYPVAGLILESTFTSVYRAKTRLPILFGDKYQNLKKVQKSVVPTLVIHGTKDTLIPFWHGQKLYQKSAGPKQFYWIEGAGHYDYQSHNPDYWEKLQSFASWVVELPTRSHS